MTSKIARNEACPCGSGKKYKFCHGSPAGTGQAGVRAVEMQYAFTSIILSPELAGDARGIVVNGELSEGAQRFPFLMVVRPHEDGTFEIRQFGWQNAPPIADKEAVGRQLLRYLGECLELLAVRAWPAEDGSGIEWRPVRAGEADSAHCVLLRPRLARLPGPDWSTLWDRISLKLRGDPACAVTGFSQEEVERAFGRLRQVFTAEWLEASFSAAAGDGKAVSMAAEFPHEAEGRWFPAYHLSRLAMGVICRDPALNTLVDLGLALEELEGFTGLEALRGRLAENPGLHHQACLAAELFHKGCLSSFTDDGEGDLRVILKDQPYLIRTFEVSHADMIGQIQARLRPGTEGPPVIMHALVSEGSWYRADRDLPQELEELELPGNVLALIVGNRFLGAEGGRLKRNARHIQYNDKGVDMPADRGIEALFAPSYASMEGEALNVGSYFYVL